MRIRAKSVAVAIAALLSPDCTFGNKGDGGGPEANLFPVDVPSLAIGVETHDSGITEWGPGVRATVPIGLHTPRAALQPMGSYTRLMYDGGHENRFEVGAQGRYLLASKPTDRPMWVGAELAYAWLKDEYDGGSGSYDGPSATALFGLPLTKSPLNPTLVGGVGVTHYSNTGMNLRLGITINPFNK